ncbi:chromate efflux transporter [Rhizobium sp. LjRoot30]|uniref:chromate efflux transporter n=1 Tax=Rhizobium sp. LjRoot30 TaxID=3342320 RepID=UPI003F505398
MNHRIEKDLVLEPPQAPSFGDMVAVFARIGLLSFGGPAGQIALMHRTLVDEKRWISEERFLHALNYCMLLPGPEAQQLATYVGWLLHRTRGGLAAGLLFILPGLLVILGLSAAYAVFHEAGWLQGLFFGLKAAVLAIVIEAVIRVGKRALKHRLHYAICGLSFLALFVFNIPFPVVILAAAVAGLIAGRFAAFSAVPAEGDMLSGPPTSLRRTLLTLIAWLLVWQAPLLLIFGLTAGNTDNVFSSLFGFFSQMAIVTFGGAYAVLSYVAQMASGHYGWLSPGEMLDGLALAETTPGPLVLVLCFVGFIAAFRNPFGLDPVLAGLVGGTLAAWATFAPSFLFIFVGAPYVERLRKNRIVANALSAITAAVTGVILNLALWFGLHVLFGEVGRLTLLSSPGDGGQAPLASLPWPVWASIDWAALALSLLSAVLVLRFRLGVAPVLAVAAVAGWIVRAAL